MSTTLGPAELRSILAFTVNLATYRGHTHTGRISGDPGFLQRQREKELGRSSDAQYDVAENLVMGEIKKAYPTFKFIREESASAGSLPELPTFCVDPIVRCTKNTPPRRRVQPVYRVSVHKGGRPGIVPHTRHRSTSLAPPRIPETPPFLSKAQIAVE